MRGACHVLNEEELISLDIFDNWKVSKVGLLIQVSFCIHLLLGHARGTPAYDAARRSASFVAFSLCTACVPSPQWLLHRSRRRRGCWIPAVRQRLPQANGDIHV